MEKLVAVLQLLLALILAVAVISTLVNMLLIATRPETISVVNAMIGQGVLIVCLAALAKVIGSKGWQTLKGSPKDALKNTGEVE
jgi:hypothetical protein